MLPLQAGRGPSTVRHAAGTRHSPEPTDCRCVRMDSTPPAGWQGTQCSGRASCCRHKAHSWAKKLPQAATLLLHTAKQLRGC